MKEVIGRRDSGLSIDEIDEFGQTKTYFHLPVTEQDFLMSTTEENLIISILSTPAAISAYYSMYVYYKREILLTKHTYRPRSGRREKTIWLFNDSDENVNHFSECLYREKKQNLRFITIDDMERFKTATTGEIKDTFLTIPIMRSCVGYKFPYRLGTVMGKITYRQAIEAMLRSFQTSNHLRILFKKMFGKKVGKSGLHESDLEDLSKQVGDKFKLPIREKRDKLRRFEEIESPKRSGSIF